MILPLALMAEAYGRYDDRKEKIKLLLDNGANVHIKDNFNITALSEVSIKMSFSRKELI